MLPLTALGVALRQVFDPRRGPQPSKVYDPRILLTGAMDAIGKWRGGMFDKGSFVESLDGSAPNTRALVPSFERENLWSCVR